jgi:UDPglucose 6-dehydrogenase/UDP-N-acetyl-D-galactosamine dehydrogenase
MVFELKDKLMKKEATVCIIGLGYVGLPLVKAFSNHLKVIAYDIDGEKIKKLSHNNKDKNIIYTSDQSKIKEGNFIIICVPTPITKSKDPDLTYVKSVAEIVGKNLTNGSVVVLESTVYPGVTEEVIAPILERESGQKCGVDFAIGFSPERINPGDEEHTLDKVTKIVAGMDEKTTELLASLYGLVCL